MRGVGASELKRGVENEMLKPPLDSRTEGLRTTSFLTLAAAEQYLFCFKILDESQQSHSEKIPVNISGVEIKTKKKQSR